MRFGVIVCPNCKQAKGITLASQTTQCPRCGKTLMLKKLKIFFETNSQEQLRKAIGLINAEQNGKYAEFHKKMKKSLLAP